MNLKPYGDTALLLDCESLDEAQRWFAALHDEAEVVLGARSVLLRGDPAALRSLVGRTSPVATAASLDGPQVEITVAYDGADLDDVARLTGLTPAEVVAAHTGTPWTVAFGGFAPGFSYLVGGDPRLQVPRRDSPRNRVPGGAVGLAGEFSGVYPRESPGGWQLIGHTGLAMWDTAREPPALLRAGMTVRFVAA
ncbi:5-oxoprolinase subunit B family protein [Aeromicrobium ginsengisoli]|uniref:Allophanate hydrolase subunit 1 n=1 Tax=Aeromicrobium ginsengisoli TaxID=363867 RepID=A0A5M4FDV1_9ACTN|nr:allophanate hydrolase subunit 1 [Aeromicrobium ginsengisoli]KAA1397380.1 allophanate hydrolase subunit 1 [Aeromicrobium ginsengisoli]